MKGMKLLNWKTGAVIGGVVLLSITHLNRTANHSDDSPDPANRQASFSNGPLDDMATEYQHGKEIDEIQGFLKGGEMFHYSMRHGSVDFALNPDGFVRTPSGLIVSHPLYGPSGGVVTTNPDLEVCLDILHDGTSGIAKIILGDRDVIKKGRLFDEKPAPDDKEMYDECSYPEYIDLGQGRIIYLDGKRDEGIEHSYWKGVMELKPGDNYISPVVRFEDGRWASAGADWVYVTYLMNPLQAHSYARRLKLDYVAFDGEDIQDQKRLFRKEMLEQFDVIIDLAKEQGMTDY